MKRFKKFIEENYDVYLDLPEEESDAKDQKEEIETEEEE